MARIVLTSNSKQEMKQVTNAFMGFDPELSLIRLPVKKNVHSDPFSARTNRSREQFQLRTSKWLLNTKMPLRAVENFIQMERVAEEFPGVLIRLRPN